MPNDVIETTATERRADDEAARSVLERQPATTVPEPEIPQGQAPAADIEPAAGVTALPALPEPELHTTVPAVGELQTMAQLATTFANAGLVPRDLQGRPADCLLVIMSARDLGISITDGFRLLYPIDGRVTVAPKLKLAIIRQRGLAKIWPDPDNGPTSATWHAEREGIRYRQTFTIEDARNAGLAAKDNWKKYPAQMLQWRALGYLIDVVCPEVGTGLYSADELGAITDDDGNVIDVSEVEPVVPGDTRGRGGPAGSDAPGGELPADPDELWQFQLRVHALPEAAGLAWRAVKMKALGHGVATPTFTREQLRGAKSAIVAVEKDAAKADPEWNSTQAQEAIELMAAGTVLNWLMVTSFGGGNGAHAPADVVDEAEASRRSDAAVAERAATAEADASAIGAEAQRIAAEAVAIADKLAEQPRTMGDVKQLTEQVTEVVKGFSTNEVRDELADANLPTTGGAAECRKRLIGHLVQKELTKGQAR